MPAWENINRVLSRLIQSSCLERGLLLRLQSCLAQSGRTAVLSQGEISVLITSDVQAGQRAHRDSGRLGCRSFGRWGGKNKLWLQNSRKAGGNKGRQISPPLICYDHNTALHSERPRPDLLQLCILVVS